VGFREVLGGGVLATAHLKEVRTQQPTGIRGLRISSRLASPNGPGEVALVAAAQGKSFCRTVRRLGSAVARQVKCV
jgi:hypothetical protein